MASISRLPNGHRAIQFVAPDGKRKTIRLGKVDQKTADAIRTRIEVLLQSKLSGLPMDGEVARWVGGLEGQLRDRLVAVGLVDARASATLGGWIETYIASRKDLKPGTRTQLGLARKRLLAFFGGDRPLSTITSGDADNFKIYLETERKLALNTIRRTIGRSRQFFAAAIRHKLLDPGSNPFNHLAAAVIANPERMAFIGRPEMCQILGACPDVQWRAIVILARIGGLRTPSETLAVRWEDVNWELGRLTIRDAKREHNPGRAFRVIPLFPEIRSVLSEAWELSEPGDEHVITRYRKGANLRTQLMRIILRAGLKPWPKLFQNLRSSRETELAETFPIHVVTEWLGNSQPVAARHYLQVTAEHYERGNTVDNALQKAVQQGAETAGTTRKPTNERPEKTLILPGNATSCQLVPLPQMTPTGLEPVLPA